MIFYYSHQRLIIRFLYRFVAAIPFMTLGFFWESIFWWGALAVIIVALIEVIINSKKGYFKIEADSIETLPVIAAIRMDSNKIKSTYVYNDEWTFKSEDNEIRVNKRFVKEDQRLEAESMLNDLRFKINQNLSSI